MEKKVEHFMKLCVSKFGDLLISRPAGKEAALAAEAFISLSDPNETIDLDFSGVRVMAPSWLDEFINGLRSKFGIHKVRCLPSTNPTIIESLKFVSNP